jgi:hypothetical protein
MRDLGCCTGNLVEMALSLCIEGMEIHGKLRASEMI